MTYDAAPLHDDDGASAASRRPPGRPSGGPLDAVQDPLVIDCDTCRARGIGCGDCMVTVLLGGPPLGVSLNEEERRAVDVLSAAGLIPPLRLVYGVATDVTESP